MKSYSWLRSSPCIFVFACICINHAFSKSESDQTYTKHCSSVIPRYDVTTRSNDDSLPSLSTSYFTGGDSLMRVESGRSYYYVEKNLRLRLRPDYYETTGAGVYAVEGFLHIQFPYSSDYTPANYSYSGYNHRRNRTNQTKESIRFPTAGFWSEKSRKLCMVGSAPWRGNDRDYVLKLKFKEENPTIYTGAVSGSLESTSPANSPAYFETVLIFSFLEVSSYNYSLLPKQLGKLGGVFPSRKDESLSLDATEFCLEMEQGLRSLELEYATECAGRRHRCSPVGSGDFANYLSLISIQCLKGEKKARFLATFSNYPTYSNHNEYFSVGSTVIGEAAWDDKNKRMIAVACEILDPSINLGKAVGNCDMRLSLRHPSVLTMRNDAKIVGEIWSSKRVGDSGYFGQINLTTTDDNRAVASLELRYEYTEMDRARKLCTEKKAGKKGDVYPDAQSYDMRFDMNIKNGKGEAMGWASATPSWVENDSYQGGNDMFFTSVSAPVSIAFPDAAADVVSADAVLEPEERVISTHLTKMSYKIRIHAYYLLTNLSSNISSPTLNWPAGRVEITAEGLYDERNGHLCMVGCRKLVRNSTTTFKDCEVYVEFQLPPLNGQRGGLSKGIVKSMRSKTDALRFDDMIMESTAYYREEAKRSIWRMDLEIAMVLISNTLVCIFVALQIFHVKRNPEVPSFVSIVMVVILSLGYMLPLVLNFEAVFLGNRKKSTLELGSGGRLEANEVAVRVITMVVSLLLLRLLQLVWSAKQRDGSGERKAGLVSLLLYTFGGLITFLVNWMRETSVWADLRSYAGLILDGFLVPQVVLNVLRGSADKALCHPFYVGTSAVRLVPHAYNQYRTHNYPKFDLNATYYYANPAADLYSTTWDIIIPCGIVALAVVVFVQQRHGGRCILPQRFRGLEMYEKVPTADNQ